MNNEKNTEHMSTRRAALKTMGKTTMFVAPVIATFKLTELTAKASGCGKLAGESVNPY